MSHQRSQGGASVLDKLEDKLPIIYTVFEKHLTYTVYNGNTANDEMLFRKVHNLFFKIIKRYPQTVDFIFKIMNEKFPHQATSLNEQRFYYNHAFFFCRYVSNFQQSFIPHLLDELLNLDVYFIIYHLLRIYLFIFLFIIICANCFFNYLFIFF